jgi:hypothetical protein
MGEGLEADQDGRADVFGKVDEERKKKPRIFADQRGSEKAYFRSAFFRAHPRLICFT